MAEFSCQTRVCKKCQVKKPLEEFSTYSQNRSWHHGICKICEKKKAKQYREKNKENLLCKHREYYKKNRERLLEQKKIYASNPLIKKSRRKYEQKYWKERKEKDPVCAMKRRCRYRLNAFMKNHGYKKPCKTQEMIGCDWQSLWERLLKTWENNYGKPWDGEPYHIDHIIPLSLATTEKEALELCHFTNLQMLTPKDNINKRDKILIERK